MAAPGGEWRISPEERAKSDAQFFSLNPINNVITGDQARGLFLQSGLPPVVLGQIWALADMNADGKMDKTEFCIAMHLIQKKLQGFEVPKVLPQSLLVETQAFRSMGGGSMGMTMGMFPSSAAFGTAPLGGGPMQMHGMTNGNPAMVGFGRGVPVAGFAAAPMTSPPSQPASAASGDWGVPQPAKLKYTQKFNVLDKSKKGYLTGLEAREVLTQSNLTHNLLAQIWNLSDIDNDGKLTTDEFVLSMYLVDQARVGKVLPTKLPPELVPPSYRRTRSGSAASAPTGTQITSPPGQAPGVPAQPASGMMAQKEAFGDLLGGYNMSAPPVQMEEPVLPLEPVQPVTFEDKRQENFIKGQAELERRRELLRAEQKKMEAERLAHERAEAEKRERVRLEQERKKQQEMEKLLQKQREIEEQREEQRRKALEQREAARREMERQRALEWERQRREQLMSEKLREQNQVDQMKSEVGKLKMELENLETRKGELHMKIQGSRLGVTELTNSIDGMRGIRDEKLANIEKAREEVMMWNDKVQKIEAERQGIDQNLQLQNSTTSDTYRTVMHSYNSKKVTIEKLKSTMEEMEKDTATKLEEIDKVNASFNEINTQLTEINNKHQELMSQLNSKQDEWKKIKRQRDGIPSPDKDEIITKDNTSWGFENAFNTTATPAQQSQSDAWGQSNAFPAPSTKTPATNGGGDVWGSDAFSTNTAAGGDGWWESAPSISSTDKKDLFSSGTANQSNNSTNSLASLDWDSSNSLTKNSSVEWPSMGAQNPITAPTIAVNSWPDTAGGSNALLDWDMSSASTNTTASMLDQQTKAEPQTNLNNNQSMDPFGGVELAGGSPPWPSEALSVSRPDPVDRSTSSEKELVGLWAAAAEGLTDNGTLAVQQPAMSATSAAGSDVTLTQDMFSFDSPTASEPTKSLNTDFWTSGLSGGTEDAFGFGTSASQSQSSFAWSDAFQTKSDEPEPGVSWYRANFQFDARNPDELSLLPEDLVKVRQSKQEGAEPGWIFGTANGKGGWFPEAYVEKVPEEQPSVDATPTPEMSAVHDAQVDAQANSFETDFSQQRAEEPAQAPSTLNLSNESSFKAVTTSVPSPTPGQGEQAEEGLKAQALYPWRAKKENHLTFNKGDVITVHEQQDMWWSGALGDRVGWFPKSYVKILGASTGNHSEAEPQITVEGVDISSSPAPEQNGGGEYYAAIYAYSSSEPGDLTFNQGDVIMVSKKDGDWWTGTINGLSGIFPANYVKEMETQVEGQVEEEMEEETTKEESPIDQPAEETFADFGAFGAETSTEDPFADTVQWGGGAEDDIWNSTPATEAEAEGAGGLFPSFGSDPFAADPFAAEPRSNADLNDQQDMWSGAGVDPGPGDVNQSAELFGDNYLSTVTEENSDNVTELPAVPPLPPGAKLNKKPEIANVIAAYQATGQEQLSLMPGQLIQVRKKSNSGWWEGELQARGQKRKIGWFPANYVKLLGPSSARSTPDPNRASLSSSPMKCGSPNLSDAGSRTETPQPPQPTSAPALEQVMAIFTYEAQNSDELTFHKGSIINVILKDDPDWWKGEVNGQTGLFPSNYVTPLADAVVDNKDSTGTSWPWSQHMAMSPTENKRQSAIQEMIDTEENYVKDMKIVTEAFIKPLLADGAFSQEDVQRVFVNWKELIMCNTKILKAFRVRKKMTGAEQIIHMIGDILCEKLPHMTVYIRFCSCQLNAAALVQDKFEKDTNNFKEVHRKCIQHPGTKGMPLSSFLLKPIQRITKYPLLIEKILQNTPPEHPDNQNLQDALAKATEVCQQVNEGVREKENSDRLEWIQNRVNCEGLAEKITFNSVTNCLGPRKFLYSGTLCKAKSGKELVGFLFNDFLLLVQPQRPVGQMASVFSLDTKTNVNFRMYRTPVFLNEVMIKKTAEGETVDPNLFHLSHIDRVYSLKAVTATERDTWVKKIEEASRHYIETERKKRERAHSSRLISNRGCGRLLVIVLEGYNLIPSDANGKSDPYCEVSMGVQEHRTKVINNTLNPKWNASMQFTIKDLQEDVLCITVYDRDLFTPNDFLGRTEVRIKDIVKETREKKGPISKRLVLHEVDSGEVVVKLDLQIYDIS